MSAPTDEQQTPDRDSPQELAQSSHLPIGRVVGARGLRGEMRVDLADPDATQFLRADEVYLGKDHICHRVLQARLFKRQGLLQVEGIEDRNTAEFWRDAQIYVSADNVASLEEGEYYYRQIVGLSVITEGGEELGRVTNVLPTGANDVYVVEGPEGELLLPAIKDVVLKIDLDRGVMLVTLLDGLRD